MSRISATAKNGCLGCLGLLGLFLIFVGINTVVVLNRSGDKAVQDQTFSPATAASQDLPAGAGATARPAPGRGLLVLELGQGEFEVHPGEPGAGIVVKTHYDANIYAVEEFSYVWPDSAWVYRLRTHRTISGLQALLNGILGGAEPARIDICIPPDLPLGLDILVREGGLSAELGGLWLTDLELRYRKCGVELNIESPLAAPVQRVAIHGRMGGGEITNLGNASPRNLSVSCSMGGMALDLGGAWSRDCEVTLDLHMGGMAVTTPENIKLEGLTAAPTGLRRNNTEVPLPVLRVHQKVKLGEIEFQ